MLIVLRCQTLERMNVLHRCQFQAGHASPCLQMTDKSAKNLLKTCAYLCSQVLM